MNITQAKLELQRYIPFKNQIVIDNDIEYLVEDVIIAPNVNNVFPGLFLLRYGQNPATALFSYINSTILEIILLVSRVDNKEDTYLVAKPEYLEQL